MQSKLAEISTQDMTPEQTRVLADIVSGPRGNLSGPFLAWIHSPGLAGPAQELGAYCRYATSLETRLTELVILQTASWWQSQAEWLLHEQIAREAGLDDAVIAALKTGDVPHFDNEDELLVFQIGQSIYRDRRLTPALYARGIDCFGSTGMVELVGVFGYYALVSMTLNVFEMRPEGDAPLPFPEEL
jgi:4-carboxymuconolactone decarboxylase